MQGTLSHHATEQSRELDLCVCVCVCVERTTALLGHSWCSCLSSHFIGQIWSSCMVGRSHPFFFVCVFFFVPMNVEFHMAQVYSNASIF